MGQPTYTPLTETFHNGGFIVSEANGHASRSAVTLMAGAIYLAGTVMGQITTGTSASAAALGANTGNGTFGSITPVSVPTQIGAYIVTFTDATHFTVTAPDGATATGTTGVAFGALGIGFTITAGGAAFVAGDSFNVTATQKVGNPTVASAAGAGNTGNGTVGSLTANGYAPLRGAYTVEFNDATHYVVNDPNGSEVGHGTTGVAYASGGLGFTITAGGAAFVAGDSFVITVADGSGKWRAWDPGNADGSQVVAGILFATKNAMSGDKPGLVMDANCEVNASELVWPAGSSAAAQALGLQQLRDLGIKAR